LEVLANHLATIGSRWIETGAPMVNLGGRHRLSRQHRRTPHQHLPDAHAHWHVLYIGSDDRPISAYFLFFFAGLGAFNGVVLAAFLAMRKPQSPLYFWLALLVLMISVRTGKSVLFVFWPEVPRLVLQIGLTACFFIGPCLIGFVRAWRDPEALHTRHDRVVFSLLVVAALLFGIAFSYQNFPNWWGGTIAKSVGYVWLLGVIGALALVLRPNASAEASRRAAGLERSLVVMVVAGVSIIWLAYFTAGFTAYITGALSFSFVLYLSVVIFLRWSKAAPSAPKPYHDRKIASAQAAVHLSDLQQLMEREALFADAGLSLKKLARRLRIPSARLSQLLNDNNRTTFKQYLCKQRVEAAKEVLKKAAPVSMQQVAESVGFVSLSTFYHAFKKCEGITPAAWRQTWLTQNEASRH
jgi:AraC-like DNA-binding protein